MTTDTRDKSVFISSTPYAKSIGFFDAQFWEKDRSKEKWHDGTCSIENRDGKFYIHGEVDENAKEKFTKFFDHYAMHSENSKLRQENANHKEELKLMRRHLASMSTETRSAPAKRTLLQSLSRFLRASKPIVHSISSVQQNQEQTTYTVCHISWSGVVFARVNALAAGGFQMRIFAERIGLFSVDEIADIIRLHKLIMAGTLVLCGNGIGPALNTKLVEILQEFKTKKVMLGGISQNPMFMNVKARAYAEIDACLRRGAIQTENPKHLSSFNDYFSKEVLVRTAQDTLRYVKGNKPNIPLTILALAVAAHVNA